MIKYKTLLESIPNSSVVIAIADFNPPSIGHEILIKKVKKIAEYQNSDYIIYVSGKQDRTNNPLSITKKLHYLNLIFPNTNFVPNDQENLLGTLRYLNNKYRELYCVVGNDNFSDVNHKLISHNNSVYYFNVLKVIELGIDNPDYYDGFNSPVQMRIAASKGNFDEFQLGLPSFFRTLDAKRLMNDIRDGMGLPEIRYNLNIETNPLRENYISGKIFNVGNVVESKGKWYQIVGKGTNYLHVQDGYGNSSKKWLQECRVIEEAINNIFRSKDRVEVGRIIGYLLGVDDVQSLSAELAVDKGLMAIRSKRLTPEVINIIKRMLKMADSMRITYNKKMIPLHLYETIVDKNKNDNIARDIMNTGDFELLQALSDPDNYNDSDDEESEEEKNKKQIDEPGHVYGVNDTARKLRLNYMEDVVAADRGFSNGRKTIHAVTTFSNSKGKDMLHQTDPSDKSPVLDKDDRIELRGKGLYGPKVSNPNNKPLLKPAAQK